MKGHTPQYLWRCGNVQSQNAKMPSFGALVHCCQSNENGIRGCAAAACGITLAQGRIMESLGQISHSSLWLRTTNKNGNCECPDSSHTTILCSSFTADPMLDLTQWRRPPNRKRTKFTGLSIDSRPFARPDPPQHCLVSCKRPQMIPSAEERGWRGLNLRTRGK